MKASLLEYHLHSRRQRMISDPDFMLFNIIIAGKPPIALWTIPRNIYEVELCKFVAKLWTLQDIPPETCLLCNSPFTNVFEHVTTSCADTLLLRDAW